MVRQRDFNSDFHILKCILTVLSLLSGNVWTMFKKSIQTGHTSLAEKSLVSVSKMNFKGCAFP